MDKITKYGLYDYKQFSFEDLIKKYDIGIDSDVMVKEFERLLPDIDKMDNELGVKPKPINHTTLADDIKNQNMLIRENLGHLNAARLRAA